jgi:UDPglucose 6-dehydrogenase
MKNSPSARPVLFIAVGTPSSEDGSADLKYVLSVGDAVARHRNNR